VASRRKVVHALPNPSGAGFYVWFRHPHQANRATKSSCQTTDPNLANLIAAHLSVFLNAADEYPLTDQALQAAAAGFNARALEIWFGRPAPIGNMTSWEIQVRQFIKDNPDARAHFDKFTLLEQENPILRTRVEELEAEIARLRRQCGVHARVPLRSAVEAWAVEYPTGHGRRTVQEATKVVRDFLTWAEEQHGKKVFVGQIRRRDVAQYLAQVKKSRPGNASGRGVADASTPLRADATVIPDPLGGAAPGLAQSGTPHARAREGTAPPDSTPKRDNELSPVTRLKFRAYLSTFFSWARDRYDLQENPAKDIAVPGVERSAEDIQAIRRYEDLVEIATALQDWPYWRALFLTGVLAGPRWDELRTLRIADVGLQARTLTIRAAKTGRQRSTPIESTLLLSALRQHLERRARERQGQDVDLPLFGGPGDGAQPEAIRAAALSDLLFPSYVDEGTRPRTKTEPGLWSDSSTFLRAWRRAIQAAWRQKSSGQDWDKAPPTWSFQPREWRHSAGSAMGHCGCSSLQISQWLGNSEAIARRHYIPPVSGDRWPLEYTGRQP
jgi:integrase